VAAIEEQYVVTRTGALGKCRERSQNTGFGGADILEELYLLLWIAADGSVTQDFRNCPGITTVMGTSICGARRCVPTPINKAWP